MSRIAQKGPVRRRRDQPPLPKRVGNERLPDGAVPADGGRHPRHQPPRSGTPGRQAAGRPVPPPCACWAATRPTRRRHRGPQARGADHAGPERLPHEAPQGLWDTLDVGYFMRHDAADIAWHAPCCRAMGHGQMVVRATVAGGRRSAGAGVHPRPEPTCLPASAATFDQAASASWTPRSTPANNGYALDTFQVVTHAARALPRDDQHGRSRTAGHTIEDTWPLPRPAAAGCHAQRQEAFPIAPHVTLRPDEKPALAAQHLGQRPRRPAVLAWPAVLARTTQPATGQGRRRWANGWKTPS